MALGLVATGVAIGAAGIYIGDTDDAPGAALALAQNGHWLEFRGFCETPYLHRNTVHFGQWGRLQPNAT
jgi:hypothetical protein